VDCFEEERVFQDARTRTFRGRHPVLKIGKVQIDGGAHLELKSLEFCKKERVRGAIRIRQSCWRTCNALERYYLQPDLTAKRSCSNSHQASRNKAHEQNERRRKSQLSKAMYICAHKGTRGNGSASGNSQSLLL
jgi:hypothetical protein